MKLVLCPTCLVGNATAVYYMGYAGPSRAIYATCMDCELNLTRTLAIHTLDSFNGTYSPVRLIYSRQNWSKFNCCQTILLAVTGIDPANAHSLSVVNLLDSENARNSQLTFGGLVATVEDNGDAP